MLFALSQEINENEGFRIYLSPLYCFIHLHVLESLTGLQGHIARRGNDNLFENNMHKYTFR